MEECLTSKLLRWLVASVIHGKLSAKHDNSNSSSKRSHGSLLPLLQAVEKGCEVINTSKIECEEILASTIFYLQQNLGMHCSKILPSVVSALSVLSLSDFIGCDGM